MAASVLGNNPLTTYHHMQFVIGEQVVEKALKRLVQLPYLRCARDFSSPIYSPAESINAMLNSSPIVQKALSTPAESFRFTRLHVKWPDQSKRPFSLQPFEMRYKRYTSKEEVISWEARVNMLTQAMGHAEGEKFNGIFSLSIEPTDPKVRQTLYFRHGIMMLKEVSNLIEEVSWANSNDDRIRLNQVNGPLIGFLKPYKTFSSPQGTAEVDPERCAESIQCKVSRIEDINRHLADIKDKVLLHRLQNVVFSFLQDQHARKIYVVILAEGKINRKLFIKV